MKNSEEELSASLNEAGLFSESFYSSFAGIYKRRHLHKFEGATMQRYFHDQQMSEECICIVKKIVEAKSWKPLYKYLPKKTFDSMASFVGMSKTGKNGKSRFRDYFNTDSSLDIKAITGLCVFFLYRIDFLDTLNAWIVEQQNAQ